MYSGITSGRVLNGDLLYAKILEVNLFAFAYRLFRRDFSPLDGTYCMDAICPVEWGVCLHLPTDCFVEISPNSTGHIASMQYVPSSGEKSLRNSL